VRTPSGPNPSVSPLFRQSEAEKTWTHVLFDFAQKSGYRGKSRDPVRERGAKVIINASKVALVESRRAGGSARS